MRPESWSISKPGKRSITQVESFGFESQVCLSDLVVYQWIGVMLHSAVLAIVLYYLLNEICYIEFILHGKFHLLLLSLGIPYSRESHFDDRWECLPLCCFDTATTKVILVHCGYMVCQLYVISNVRVQICTTFFFVFLINFMLFSWGKQI